MIPTKWLSKDQFINFNLPDKTVKCHSNVTVESTLQILMNLKGKAVNMKQVTSPKEISDFDKKLFKRYFKKNNIEESGVLVKLFHESNENDDIQAGSDWNTTFNRKGNKSLMKKKAKSPEPHAVYFGIKSDAFFNKRKGILKPDIKFRVVNLIYKHKAISPTIRDWRNNIEVVKKDFEVSRNTKYPKTIKSRRQYSKITKDEYSSSETQSEAKGTNNEISYFLTINSLNYHIFNSDCNDNVNLY